jgi:hypothetical protein
MLLQELSDEFDELCARRHDAGAEKYGPLKFAGVDTLEEALQEVLDMGNYIRYTYIKLRLLQLSIANQVEDMEHPDSKLVPQGFISLRRD